MVKFGARIVNSVLTLVGVVALLILRRPVRNRWVLSCPDTELTWGIPISGSHFVKKLNEYGALREDARLLEVGTGYGRILQSLLESGE